MFKQFAFNEQLLSPGVLHSSTSMRKTFNHLSTLREPPLLQQFDVELSASVFQKVREGTFFLGGGGGGGLGNFGIFFPKKCWPSFAF